MAYAKNTPTEAKARAGLFHGRPGKVVAKTDFEVPSALVLMGEGVSIIYRSNKIDSRNKTGKSQDYEHHFGRGVKIYCDPTGKNIFVFGGRLTVSDWIRY